MGGVGEDVTINLIAHGGEDVARGAHTEIRGQKHVLELGENDRFYLLLAFENFFDARGKL